MSQENETAPKPAAAKKAKRTRAVSKAERHAQLKKPKLPTTVAGVLMAARGLSRSTAEALEKKAGDKQNIIDCYASAMQVLAAIRIEKRSKEPDGKKITELLKEQLAARAGLNKAIEAITK